MGRKKRRRAGTAPPEPQLSGIALLLTEVPSATLDLHRLTAAQAETRLFDFLRSRSVDAPGRVVHVITGRGNHSDGAPVLPALVRDLLVHELTPWVREHAGLPGGGGVAIRVR